MTTVVGKIERKWVKEFNGTKFYSFVIGDTWYGTGETEVSFNEGDEVSFEAGKNKKGYPTADASSVTLVGRAEADPAARSTGPVAGDRQTSIVMQNSTERGIQIAMFLVQADLVQLGAKNASKSKKMDAFLALMDEMTLRCFNHSFNPTEFLAENEEASDEDEFNPNGPD